MNEQPLVSIIIPFLNTEQFLQEAIESVFAQTYATWELLLVDDGSSDGSTAIARRYAEVHPQRVRYLEHDGHQNRGPAASRNLGILHSKGEYIAFLDADDIWFPHKLEQQVAILQAKPDAGMLYGLSQWWYSWMGGSENAHLDFTYDLGVQPDSLLEPPSSLFQFFVTQQAAIPTPTNIMIRRAIAENVGGFEENFRGIYAVYDDQAFYAKVALTAPILASNSCWDYYRQHPDSICTVAEKQGQEVVARLFFLNWLEEYIERKGFKGTDLWRALRKEIWSYRYPALKFLLKSGQSFMQRTKDLLWRLGSRTIPISVRARLWARRHSQPYLPPVGRARLGDLRRLAPFSRDFGYDRGRPVDRYYIEKFLAERRLDVRGRVLEIADDNYTRQFGGEKVTKSDILHVSPGDPRATIIGDLATADHIPSDTFDCIILTQTLQVVFDVRAVLRTLYRLLKPGGVVLVTAPGISMISRYDMDRWGYYWSFTSLSLKRLFAEVFPSDHIQVKPYGNVLTATAFLYGMATEELTENELEYFDPDYELLIGVSARKPDYGSD